MIRIAVLGCGRIGVMHAANIAAHPRAALTAVFDINQAAAEAVAAATGAKVYDSVASVLAAAEVDAVLIATATNTHADILEACVAAGKAVLCEKPIDLSLARVNALASTIKTATAPVQLGFMRRFDPGHRALQKAVQDGELGELRQVVITSRDPGLAPEAYLAASGGIFRDMTIHDLDMARFILGEEPVEVSATGSRLVDAPLMDRLGDVDAVTVVLKTASGKQAIITNCRHSAYGYDQRVEALGSKGMGISENRRRHGLTLHTSDHTDQAEPLLHFFIERYREAFDAEIDAFVDSIETGSAPKVGFEDGRLALVLAEAAILSMAEGRVVQTCEVSQDV